MRYEGQEAAAQAKNELSSKVSRYLRHRKKVNDISSLIPQKTKAVEVRPLGI